MSNTLGTALGDFVATDTGLGFGRGALIFAGLIAIVAALHFFTKLPGSVLFWAVYVLTRPLGATLGGTLTKPFAEGGLNLSRVTSSLVIAAVMIVLIFVTHTHRRANQSAGFSERQRSLACWDQVNQERPKLLFLATYWSLGKAES